MTDLIKAVATPEDTCRRNDIGKLDEVKVMVRSVWFFIYNQSWLLKLTIT